MNHYPLLQADMDAFEDHLALAVYDINQEYQQMAISPTLKGLGKKIAQFKHDVEFEAEKISNDVDSARVETMETFAGVGTVLSDHKKDLEDVKSFVAEVAQATNGGPPLNSPKPAPTSGSAQGDVTPPPLPTVEAIDDDTGEVIRPKLST